MLIFIDMKGFIKTLLREGLISNSASFSHKNLTIPGEILKLGSDGYLIKRIPFLKHFNSLELDDSNIRNGSFTLVGRHWFQKGGITINLKDKYMFKKPKVNFNVSLVLTFTINRAVIDKNGDNFIWGTEIEVVLDPNFNINYIDDTMTPSELEELKIGLSYISNTYSKPIKAKLGDDTDLNNEIDGIINEVNKKLFNIEEFVDSMFGESLFN